MLPPDNFNIIFDHIISEMKNELGAKADLFCRTLENRKGLLFRAYDGARSNVRFRYMQNPNSHLDRHKCAAAFMVAFLEIFEDKDNNALNIEFFAITLGLLILKIFINTRSERYRDSKMVVFIEKTGFVFPSSICDEGTYKHNFALGIYYDRKENVLSALSLANALFLIESHNRILAERY